MGNCCGSSATVPSESAPTAPALKTQAGDRHSQNTSQSAYQASEPLSTASDQTLHVVSLPNGNDEKHPDPTVPRRRGTTPITLHTPRAVRPERVQSQGLESALRDRDGADYLPASGDVLAAQNPRRQETFSQRPRLHPPGEISRAKSDNPLGNEHSTQFGSFQVLGTNSTPVEKQGPPRFRPTLQSLLSKDFRYAVSRCPIDTWLLSSIVHRFRLLVVGKVRVIDQTGPRCN
jgi:hypothetical protein